MSNPGHGTWIYDCMKSLMGSSTSTISLSHPQEDLSPGKSYHLKWSGHGACLAHQFEESVSKSEVLTDVTVVAGLDVKTSVFRSHRILLSASSEYFLVGFLRSKTYCEYIRLLNINYSNVKNGEG